MKSIVGSRTRRRIHSKPGLGLACLSLAFALGCSPSEIRPEDLVATVVQFGEFEIREGRPVHVRETSQISCELGRMFGVDYRIEYPEGSAGPVPVRFRWIHPYLEIPRLAVRGTESAAGSSNPVAPPGATSIEGRSLWSISHPEELVSGRYEFRIQLRDGSKLLASHVFEVVGC
jgi:hypothetical protein